MQPTDWLFNICPALPNFENWMDFSIWRHKSGNFRPLEKSVHPSLLHYYLRFFLWYELNTLSQQRKLKNKHENTD